MADTDHANEARRCHPHDIQSAYEARGLSGTSADSSFFLFSQREVSQQEVHGRCEASPRRCACAI